MRIIEAAEAIVAIDRAAQAKGELCRFIDADFWGPPTNDGGAA